jgi:hypothetical protein
LAQLLEAAARAGEPDRDPYAAALAKLELLGNCFGDREHCADPSMRMTGASAPVGAVPASLLPPHPKSRTASDISAMAAREILTVGSD